MILLWLALGLLDKQSVRPAPETPTYVGGGLKLGLVKREPDQKSRASENDVAAKKEQEITISHEEMAKLVEYHANQRARIAAVETPIALPKTSIAESIQRQILPSPLEIQAMIEREMDLIRQERARQLIIAQESEMLEAAQAVLFLMLQES